MAVFPFIIFAPPIFRPHPTPPPIPTYKPTTAVLHATPIPQPHETKCDLLARTLDYISTTYPPPSNDFTAYMDAHDPFLTFCVAPSPLKLPSTSSSYTTHLTYYASWSPSTAPLLHACDIETSSTPLTHAESWRKRGFRGTLPETWNTILAKFPSCPTTTKSPTPTPTSTTSSSAPSAGASYAFRTYQILAILFVLLDMLLQPLQGRRLQWTGFLAGVLVLMMVVSDMGVDAVVQARWSWEGVWGVAGAFAIFEVVVDGVRVWVGGGGEEWE